MNECGLNHTHRISTAQPNTLLRLLTHTRACMCDTSVTHNQDQYLWAVTDPHTN